MNCKYCKKEKKLKNNICNSCEKIYEEISEKLHNEFEAILGFSIRNRIKLLNLLLNTNNSKIEECLGIEAIRIKDNLIEELK